ncbi:MAG: UvrB/UvrC motif-containing protein [Crocinitomicaceae bacterium]
MKKLIVFLVAVALNTIGYSQESNKELLEKAKTEMRLAAEKEDYEKAAALKKEIEVRNQIETAVKNGDYEEAARLNKALKSSSSEPTSAENHNPEEHLLKSSSPGYTGPAPGKALVELVRVTSYKYNADFPLFIGNKYIGSSWGIKAKEATGLNGVGHIRLELDPGHHLIWTSADHHYFVDIEVAADQTYIIYIDATLGIKKIANTNLTPIHPYEENKIIRALKVIDYYAPQTASQEVIDAKNAKLNKKGWIQKVLTKYENELKNNSEFSKKVTTDMAIPKKFLIAK